MISRSVRALPIMLVLLAAQSGWSSSLEELRVKRKAVFEFSEQPTITRTEKNVRITFASKANCDATVAVEDTGGRIIRHLASGVLGENAPPPFQKGNLKQHIVWDGKDDQGIYVKNIEDHVIRVSLGLKPQFERTLFWSPHKRIGHYDPVLCAAQEGIYVFEGDAADHLRLFDHDGNYLRTIYPFPAHQVSKVKGLQTHKFEHLEDKIPLKQGYHQATLLSSGTSGELGGRAEGYAAHSIAAHNGKIALAYFRLNRLASDGSSGGLPLNGPKVTVKIKLRGPKPNRYPLAIPRSMAFSPDGKYLYLAGYQWRSNERHYFDWLHGVARMEYGKDEEPKAFAGSLKQDDLGTEKGKFSVATSVACDAKGRVYVSDYFNDRIQVFTPEGKFYKSIPVEKPVHVEVHPKSGEIYVFSWFLVTRWTKKPGTKPTFTRLGPVDQPKVITHCPLPLVGHSSEISWNISGGLPFRVALDGWAKEPTILLLPGAAQYIHSGNGSILQNWKDTGIKLLVEQKGKLVEKRSFGADVQKAVVRSKPAILSRQRLCVNPASGKLYVAEGDSGVMKSVNQLVEIDPESGKIKLTDLPMGSEDLCFDVNGNAFLRTGKYVVRFSTEADTWREIPFDYGEEVNNHSWGMGARAASFVSGLSTPGHRSHSFWQLGGLDVSLKGHLVVTTCNGANPGIRMPSTGTQNIKLDGRAYTPKLYPGRMTWGEIHIWDKHGKLIYEDAVPGMGHLNGIGIDQQDNLYMLAAARRVGTGKGYAEKLKTDSSGTILKVGPKQSKTISPSTGLKIPIAKETAPKRPLDLQGMTTGWVEGAEWFYGNVGFCTPRGCICWNSRFDLDYFNRSFGPEPLTYSVGVVDSAGNLIVRLGRYGNVDDGKPLVPDGGPKNVRAIGGDEVSLMYGCYVASHTDKRLFIADAGNARMLSIKLNYHKEARLKVSDVKAP